MTYSMKRNEEFDQELEALLTKHGFEEILRTPPKEVVKYIRQLFGTLSVIVRRLDHNEKRGTPLDPYSQGDLAYHSTGMLLARRADIARRHSK